jgi:hypothetical protein
MFARRTLHIKKSLLVCLAFAGCLILLGCSIDVKDHGNGETSKVDIDTPIGGIHVDEQADVRDTGLPVYPGARQKSRSDHDSKNANVNVSSEFFGVKVVAVEYESDDSPSKVLAFYRDQMKKFGSIVECRTDKQSGDLNVKAGGQTSSLPVRCNSDNGGNVVELKTGTEDNQHLVSVEPQDKGSDFALVYVRARSKQGDI